MSDQVAESVFSRTLRNLRTAWQDVAGTMIGPAERALRPTLPDQDARHVREQMEACLDSHGGEVSARARAAALGRAYLSLNPEGRRKFLHIMATEFDTNRAEVDAAITELHGAGGPAERYRAETQLRNALIAPRRRLLTQFNALPEGVKFLVDLRAELIPLVQDDPELVGLEADLRELLAGWFDIGFLELRRITWQAPAALLEKLIAYEAVHEIQSWEDLRNRLASDRRCFAFFHPRMPDEPLIFVEVALTDGIADNIQTLLDETAPLGDPGDANAAIFYSISNAQQGLAGISFGGFLIKQVVDELARELPNLRHYVTLSPIPGFRSWLWSWLEKNEDGLLTTATEVKAIENAVPPGSIGPPLRLILERHNWHRDEALVKIVQRPLMRLCAHYLIHEKARGGRARDPVSHFHLSNGAVMERLNWLADTSPKGLGQSLGLMINYAYKLDDIAKNHEEYTGEGKVPASAGVRGLLR